MTTLEAEVTAVVPSEDETETAKKGRKRDLDFTKHTEKHQELADFVNARSGIEPLTANQVKALLTLKTDFTDTPEQKAKREAAKAEREAAAKKYEGLSPEQVKVEKAAEKAEKQAEKLRARVEEALQRAKDIREGKEATGEDIAAAVEAEQVEFSEAPARGPGGRFTRNR